MQPTKILSILIYRLCLCALSSLSGFYPKKKVYPNSVKIFIEKLTYNDLTKFIKIIIQKVIQILIQILNQTCIQIFIQIFNQIFIQIFISLCILVYFQGVSDGYIFRQSWINIWIQFRQTLDKADGQIYRRVMQPTKSLSILIYRLWHDVTRQRAFQYAIWMVIYCPACLAIKGLCHFFSEGQGFQDTMSSIFFDNITYQRGILVVILLQNYIFLFFRQTTYFKY